MRGVKRNSPAQVLADFIYDDCWELFKPGQVKEEVVGLAKVLQKRRPQTIVEIGTGRSGGMLFVYSRTADKRATIISVDLPGGEFGNSYPAHKIPIFKRIGLRGQKIHLIRASSHDKETFEKVRSLLNGRLADFIFIDGDHTYEGVKQDFEMYGALLAPDGIIALQDIVPCKHPDCHVEEFWQDIKNSYVHREIVKDWNQSWAGIGLIEKRPITAKHLEFTGERLVPAVLKETDETYQEHIERYKFASQFVKGMNVLDASCGAGYGSKMLAQTAKQVHGIDISPETISYASERYAGANIHYEVMDIKELRFPSNHFDAVVSFETIEHVAFQKEFLDEVRRVLKPGGLLILSTPNIETTCKGKKVHTPFHVKELTLKELLELVQGFEGAEAYSQKMTYHKWLYKRLRLFSRYAKENLRKKIVQFCEKRYARVEDIPTPLRILYYEFALKFKIFASAEKNPFIKPTFWIIKAKAKK